MTLNKSYAHGSPTMAHLNPKLEEPSPDVKDEVSKLHNEECMSSWTGTTTDAPSVVPLSTSKEEDQRTIPVVPIKAVIKDLSEDKASSKEIPENLLVADDLV